MARVKTVLRRARTSEPAMQPELHVGELFIDSTRHETVIRGDRVQLSPKEFHLLHFPHLECPGEGKVELPQARTSKSAHAGIGKRRSEWRLRKRKSIEEVPGRMIAVRISQNLVGALSDQYSIADAKPGPLHKLIG